MTDYTPKDYEIRDAWQEFAFKDDGSHQDEFDRWLEEHDRQVAENAYDDGFSEGVYYHEDTAYAPLNPYRLRKAEA